MLSRPTYAAPDPGNPQPAPEVNPIQQQRQNMLSQSLLNYGNPAAGVATGPDPYGIASHDARGVAYQSVLPDQLVGTRLDKLLASDNPYMRAAHAAGIQQASSRGLLNSSIAAGTSENAAIAAGLPIAQGEAQQYSAVGAANQGASNQQLLGDTAADAQVQSAALGAGAQITSAGINSQTQMRGQDIQSDEAKQQLGYNYASLTQQGNQFNTEQQRLTDQFNSSQAQAADQFQRSYNQSQGQFMTNQSWNQYRLGMDQQMSTQSGMNQAFGYIMANPDMTPAQRTAAMQNVKDFYTSQASQNATIPAWVPPWVGNANFWTGG